MPAFAVVSHQAWSIAFHSWLTFVMLLSACIIWMIPQKRTLCLHLSPIIVSYAVVLVSILYVYNLPIDDLPTETSGGYKYTQIGLDKYKYPVVPLAIQVS